MEMKEYRGKVFEIRKLGKLNAYFHNGKHTGVEYHPELVEDLSNIQGMDAHKELDHIIEQALDNYIERGTSMG